MAEEGKRRDHLIVLVHGLWGSAQNMARLESVIHHSLDHSNMANIHTYAPQCFSHFKTYDGVEAIGNYILPDLLQHIENLHSEHDISITEISFIGYSLGGLVCRYIVGELYELDFFKSIKPGFFTTFATPHLGVTFYKGTVMNYLGSIFLGQSGRDLFLVGDEENIIYKLSDPNLKYYKGLEQFETKISIANAKFDRTVGFYSAFITKYDPFNDWDNIDPKYITDLPTSTLKENNKHIECLVVDFKNSKIRDKSDKQTKKENINEGRVFPLIVMSLITTCVFPILLSVSTFATVKSYFRNRILEKENVEKQWKMLSHLLTTDKTSNSRKHDTNESDLNGDEEDEENDVEKEQESDGYNEEEQLKPNKVSVSHVTREIVENGLNIISNPDEYVDELVEEENGDKQNAKNEIDSGDDTIESFKIDLDFDLNYKSKSAAVDQLLDNLVSNDLSDTPIVENLDPLPFSEMREKILNNLNTINWIKITVLLHNLNSHQSVVGRRGFERTPESIPFLFLFTFLIETSLKKHKSS